MGQGGQGPTLGREEGADQLPGVLAVGALGDTLAQARDAAYEGVRAITWEGAQYRTDIALKAVQGAITVPELRN